MRIIKFRAYDKEHKSMCDVIDFSCMNYPEKYSVMQFTGLLDRHGKEIYEGDIVHFNTLNGNNMYYEVRWSDVKTGFKPTRLTKTNQAEVEVIGNIYENPELLTNK